MKIIEAMKKIKYLIQKIDDLKGKIQSNCCEYDNNELLYGSEDKQKAKISEWIQSCEDSTKEVLRLRFAIQKTNVKTELTIEIGGKFVMKTICEWIHRRRDLSKMDFDVWNCLGDRGNKKHIGYMDKKGEEFVAKLKMYFDPEQRDVKKDLYKQEPSLIDGSLEVKNAITDLIE